MQRRRIALGISLALLVLASIALAAQITTYYVSITPTVVKSPVEFENGADGVSIIDNVNKTRASINATIFPLAKWISEDALRIRNVNDTLVKIRLRCVLVNDTDMVIKSMKFYLIINADEYLAIELGENGTVIQGVSDWYSMAIDATYIIKVVTEGKDGITEGTKATIQLGLEVTPA